MRSFARYWLPPLAWMALIWAASSEIGSADHSAGPFGWLVSILFPWATPPQVDVAHGVVRKLGHMIEYAILAALWFRALHTGQRRSFTSSAWLALAITVVWAITDELHQSFVPSRTASALDVMFDSAGATLALVTLRLRNGLFGRTTSAVADPLITPTQSVSR